MPKLPKKSKRRRYLPPKQKRERKPTGDQKRYQGQTWRKLSRRMRIDNPVCVICQERPSQVTDHIIRTRDGGSWLDERNLCAMCKTCHDHKSRMEAHDLELRWVMTNEGKVPATKREVFKAFK